MISVTEQKTSQVLKDLFDHLKSGSSAGIFIYQLSAFVIKRHFHRRIDALLYTPGHISGRGCSQFPENIFDDSCLKDKHFIFHGERDRFIIVLKISDYRLIIGAEDDKAVFKVEKRDEAHKESSKPWYFCD